MLDPFHLSFWVGDLDRSREFYARVLGCRVSRERVHWFDLDFFGHQVTLHQARKHQPRVQGVGPSGRALDHFGVILDKARWEDLRQRVEGQGATFRVPPRDDRTDRPGTAGRFVLVDPDGLGLEFKYDEARGGS